MIVPGLPLAERLPCPAGARVLLLGGDRVTAAALCRAGYRVDRHALDTGPLAQLAGVPFTPPVVDWPFPDSAYDAVLLLDELAFTVREEEALAEAARVLRPGGTLLLRVPATGPLAWLDGYNAYRYLRETTKRGAPLPEVAGVGWRRHYSRDDVKGLLAPHFTVERMQGSGIGLTDAVRLALTIVWRWGLRSPRADRAIRAISRAVTRAEGGLAPAAWGYSLMTLARQRAGDG